MPDGWKSFLQRWFVTTLGVLAAAEIIDGIQAASLAALLAASFLLGIFNAFLRPVLLVLALPLLFVTLGLFTIVINAILLYLVSLFVKGFYVAGLWPAIKGAVLISLVSLIANVMLGKKVQLRADRSKVPRPSRHRRQTRPPAPPPGDGPVIDV